MLLTICALGFIFAMTAMGSATVFFFTGEPRPRILQAMLGFAAGVMTAAAVWSLLLPAMEQAEAAGLPAWCPAALGMLTGSAFLAGLDALLPRLRRGGVASPAMRQTVLLLTAITLHNIPEGMAVGLACTLAARSGVTGGTLSGGALAAAALAVGIGVQNFPEGAAVSLPLRQNGFGRGTAFLHGTLSGAVEPVFGLLAAYTAVFAEALMPWLLSFAAGAMLYVVVEELVPQAQGRAGTCGFLTGFLLMMTLDTALG